jgi:hypothetical protein
LLNFSIRNVFILSLMLSMLFSCGRKESSRSESVPEDPTPATAPAAPQAPPRSVATVNDEEIPEALAKQVARRTGWPRERTIQILVDATLVIQEAVRLKQRCDEPEAPDLCAKQLLEKLYSSKNICKEISETEVDLGYQKLFDKDWPVEAYAGWMAEIRCCGGDWGDCDTDAAAVCRQGLIRWSPLLDTLSTAWAAGTDMEKAVARIFPEHCPLRVTDFFFTYWPESGPEDQPKLKSWDPAMLAEIVSLPVGEVSKPLLSSMGLHVFRLDSYKPARLKDDPMVRRKIRERICDRRVAEVRDQYVRDLRSNASIRIH